MPNRCKWYERNGTPIGGGCPRGEQCYFVHPDNPTWSIAREADPWLLDSNQSRRGGTRARGGRGGGRSEYSSRDGEKKNSRNDPWASSSSAASLSGGWAKSRPSDDLSAPEPTSSSGGWDAGGGWSSGEAVGAWGAASPSRGWGAASPSGGRGATSLSGGWSATTPSGGWGGNSSSGVWGASPPSGGWGGDANDFSWGDAAAKTKGEDKEKATGSPSWEHASKGASGSTLKGKGRENEIDWRPSSGDQSESNTASHFQEPPLRRSASYNHTDRFSSPGRSNAASLRLRTDSIDLVNRTDLVSPRLSSAETTVVPDTPREQLRLFVRYIGACIDFVTAEERHTRAKDVQKSNRNKAAGPVYQEQFEATRVEAEKRESSTRKKKDELENQLVRLPILRLAAFTKQEDPTKLIDDLRTNVSGLREEFAAAFPAAAMGSISSSALEEGEISLVAQLQDEVSGIDRRLDSLANDVALVSSGESISAMVRSSWAAVVDEQYRVATELGVDQVRMDIGHQHLDVQNLSIAAAGSLNALKDEKTAGRTFEQEQWELEKTILELEASQARKADEIQRLSDELQQLNLCVRSSITAEQTPRPQPLTVSVLQRVIEMANSKAEDHLSETIEDMRTQFRTEIQHRSEEIKKYANSRLDAIDDKVDGIATLIKHIREATRTLTPVVD